MNRVSRINLSNINMFKLMNIMTHASTNELRAIYLYYSEFIYLSTRDFFDDNEFKIVNTGIADYDERIMLIEHRYNNCLCSVVELNANTPVSITVDGITLKYSDRNDKTFSLFARNASEYLSELAIKELIKRLP